MRIGLVVQSFDPTRGGAEQWTHQFARWLLQAGHEVHIVAGHLPDAGGEATPGLHLHRVDAGNVRLGFASAAEHLLRRLPLDVIHDNGYGWHCDVFQPHGGSRAASFEQNLLLAPKWLRPVKRRTAAWLPRYRQFDALVRRQYHAPGRLYIAISKMVAGHLQQHHGVRPEQLRLVYNGVDTNRFSPAHRSAHRQALRDELGASEQDVLLLIVAHNFRLKGVPTLLQATARLRRAGYDIKTAVIGGRHLRPYQRMAARLGVGHLVQFVGSVSDPQRYYAAADIYVQPTFYDPCSLVVLEALASGLPVVTSRFNGAGELITAGRQGHVIDDPADAKELAVALEPLMNNQQRAAMGKAARLLALEHTLERNCRELLAVYGEVAECRRAA